jgi:acetyl-CoA acetyltransferase family protein
MTDAVIVSACRTAIGTAFKGTLTETTAFDLADAVVAESLARTGLGAADVDDVILGETMYGGGVVARHTAVNLGLLDVPGLALNRHCASGLAAISTAAANIRSGMDDVVIAGGTHSMSTSPVASFRTPGTQERQEWWISPSHPDRPDAPNRDMSITVGWNAAVAAGVSRDDMDQWAFDSHRKAIAAIDDGRFADEIVPIKVTSPSAGEGAPPGGAPVTFDVDEHPRRNSTLEKLASLPPLHPEIEGFSITAGNSAGLNDGAAAVVVASDAVAKAKGLPVLGVVRAWASVGVDPGITGLAPTKAIPKALDRAGLSLADVDLFEINEAFASMCVATTKQLGIDPAKVNPSGSGCSLGHPIAATGARMVTTLVHELRRRGGGIGVAAMCAGGGMGSALVVEVPSG